MIKDVPHRRSRREPDDQPPQMSAEEMQWQEEHDAEENRESALPEDEEFRLVSVLCVETYTPSTIANLADGVQQLGWVHDDVHFPPFMDLTQWTARARASPFGGAWANLSRIIDVESPPAAGRPLRAPLPQGVTSMWATLQQVTPSVTCFVANFVLDDDLGLSVERAVRPERPTAVSRTASGWAYTGPTQQRTDAAVDQRRQVRAVCHEWIRGHLPGTFSAGLSAHGAPAIEILTMKLVRPFDDVTRPQGGGPDHLWVLNVDSEVDAWESPSLPGWRLTAWDARIHADPFVMRLGARWSDATHDLGPYGGPTPDGISNRVTRTLAPFAARFALHCLLNGFEEHIAGLRDTAVTDVLERAKVTANDVDSVRRLLTGVGYDARVVAADIANLCHDRSRYHHDVVEFSPVPDWRVKHTPSLSDALRTSDGTRATNIVAAEATARETAAATASLLASLVNLRLQRAVVLLTVVLLVIAVATLALTV